MEVKQSTAIQSANAILEAETAATEAAKAAEATSTPTPSTEPIIAQTEPVVAPTVVAPAPVIAPTTTKQEDEIVEFDIPEEQVVTTEEPKATAFVSWKEAIKDVPEDELAELLGDDDFMKGMRKHIKNGGKPIDYIAAQGVDWNAVTDIDLIRDQLRDEFPDASKSQIEKIFNKRYSQSEDADEDDKELGTLMMKSDARKRRAAMIENQKNFKIADARIIVQPQTQVQQSPIDEQAKAQYQKDLSIIQNSNTYKQLFESKRVAIEIADGVKLNLGIKTPQTLMDVWFKQGKLFSLTRTPQGEPDVQLMQEAALYFSNPAQFKKSIFNAGKEAGVRSLVEEGQNAGKLGTVLPLNANAVTFNEAVQAGVKQSTIGKFASQ